MKILFDNGTPKPIARSLTGREITYAGRIGWHELENGELIRQAEEAGYEVLPAIFEVSLKISGAFVWCCLIAGFRVP